MHPSDAAQQLGSRLLKNLSRTHSPTSSKASYVDLESIKNNIKSCGVIGTAVRNSDTLLHAFAELGNERAIQQLLDTGAGVNTLNKLGYTALYLAVEKGHEHVMDVLLKNGATVDGQDFPQDPLFQAATLGRVGSVRSLLQYREGSNWRVPAMLYQTAVNGHADVLQLLLENGAKDAQSLTHDHSPCFKTPAPLPRARTALHEAVAQGFLSGIIELLINKDNIKTVDLNGKTPLHEAASGHSIATVEVLLKYGVTVQATDPEGNTALQRAVSTSPGAISPAAALQSPQEGGTYVDAIDNAGNTALHLAVFNQHKPHPAIVGLLLKYGANVNGTEKLTKRALTDAVLRENSSVIVDLLLEYNADINGLRELGYSLEDYATLVGSSTANEIIKRLSNPQRRYTQSSEPVTKRTLRTKASWFNLAKKKTLCTSSSI
jgi:serine/threonine-protein phosphatase 6 regulatory ankyrin repeat subunit B